MPETNIDPDFRLDKIVHLMRQLCVSTSKFCRDGSIITTPFARVICQGVEVPTRDDSFFYRQLRRFHIILTSHDQMHNIPTNPEARRRIAFFSNSMFMELPHASPVQRMLSFSVLTPYYNEDVVYSNGQLRTENEDGVFTLYYLQTIYAEEWTNFIERMRSQGMDDERELWTTRLRDLQLWASYRGQTLARTIRGMMYYHRALKLLHYFDSATPDEIMESIKQVAFPRLSSILPSNPAEDNMASWKFTYIVTCQNYGTQKVNEEPHAEEVSYLMKQHRSLRVAYIDKVQRKRNQPG